LSSSLRDGLTASAQATTKAPWVAQILESVTDGFIALDEEWRCHCVNKAAAAFLKTTPEEVVGKVLWDALPRLRDSRFQQGFTRAVKEKTFVKVEDYYEPLGRWYECRCHPTQDGLTVFINDATGNRKLEERLLESCQLLEMAVAGAKAGSWRIDLNPERPGYMADYVYLSRELKALLGFENHEIPNSRSAWQDRIPPEDRLLQEQAARAHVEGRTEIYHVDFRIRHKDGSLRWFSSRAKLYRDEFNRPVRWAGLDTDITERKKAEEEVRRLKEQAEQAAEQARWLARIPEENPNPVLRISNEHVMLYRNPAAERLCEYWGCWQGQKVPPVVQEIIAEALTAGKVRNHEILCADRTFWLTATPCPAEDYVNLFARDVTERARMEESLRQANERLQEQTEELQNANEELQAANEELQVQQEELQNQTEELRTQAEELQAQSEELHQSEQALRQAHEQAAWLARFPRENPNAVLRVSADGNVLYANPASTQWSGWACKVGQLLAQAVLRHLVEKAMADGRAIEQDVELGEAHYTVDAFPIVAEGYANIYGRDITERKRAEDALRQLNEELEQRVEERTAGLKEANEALRKAGDYNRSLIEAALDPLVTIGSEGRITDVNRATEKITGCPRAELIGADFSDYFTEPEQARTGYRQVFREGSVHDYPLEVQHRDGRVTPVLYNATVYRDAAGQVIGVFAAARDITRRKQAEEALQAERQRLYDVLETLPVYVVLLSQDYHVPFANRFFRERFGESHGTRCFEYLFQRTQPCEVCETYEVLKSHAPHHWEWAGPDGRNYDIHDFPFTDADGSTLIMEMGIDITERKRAEAALQDANETLEHRVEERTAALQEANERLQAQSEELQTINEDLERLNRAMVGRELRTIELKKEVNELLDRSGQPPRYPLDFEKEQP